MPWWRRTLKFAREIDFQHYNKYISAMDEEQKEIDLYAEYLNAIARTRLLFNTTDELVAVTGYKATGTAFSKYGGNNGGL